MLGATHFRRYSLLLAGTAIGSWLGLRVQFGFHLSPYLSEELAIFGIGLLGSLVVVALLTPLSLFLHRTVSAHIIVSAVTIASVLVSIALGLWIYVGFLNRPLSLVLERDWPYVLCFGLGGVGYALAYALQRRI